MKHIVALLTGLVLMCAPAMSQNYNVWVTTEGSGVAISNTGYPYNPHYPTQCPHYKHHNPHKCKICKKHIKEQQKAQKKYYKARQKAAKQHHHHHHHHH